MQLSQRVQRLRPSATLAVSARVRELARQGVDIIGFGTGEPDFDTPESIKNIAIEALRSGRTHYEPTAGDPAACRAIAEKLQRENGIACGPEHIVITTGAKHALYLALQCLLDPGRGQEVILPTPCWVSYRPMVELAGGTVIEVPGATANDFLIMPDQLRSAITPNAAAIMLNTPSNPCGTMYSEDDLRALAAVLIDHPQIVVLCDEIYEKLIFGDRAHFSIGSIDAIADRVVTINGLSKAYAMTGWRVGYLCAPGHDGALARAAAKLQGQMTSCITSFVYPAIIEALTNNDETVATMRDAFAARAKVFHDRLSAMPRLVCPRPTGAFYVFPEVSGCFGLTTPAGRTIDSSISFAEALLEEARVAVVPGDDFGDCARSHVRLSFACSEDHINEGCDRLERWLTSFAG